MTDKIDAEIERLALPGHDREVARAIHNQARIRSSRIDAIQVKHLLAIGYAAGLAAGRRQAAAAIRATHDTWSQLGKLPQAYLDGVADAAGIAERSGAPAEPAEGADR